MTEFSTVLLLSFAMFIGCMVSGYIPLMFTLSQKSIKRCTIFGAGLLVGTALSVIIPEGVEVMYNNPHHESHANPYQDTHSNGGGIQRQIKSVVPDSKHIETAGDIALHHDYYHQHHDHSKENIHRAVGASLLLGFIFMLLVDQFGGSHLHSHNIDATLGNEEGQIKLTKPQPSGKSATATLGLVVHAAADGIALGAAANTSKSDLQIIVFLAIMLHKAPAAFGLVSFLMHENLEKRKIKSYLLVFALAAPLLAMITFLLLNEMNLFANMSMNSTGIAMLFSGGTFLYVATVHVLPEVSTSQHGLSRSDVLFLITGAIIPLILNLSHSH